MHLFFHFSWVDAQNWNNWIVRQAYVSQFKKWSLYHFIFCQQCMRIPVFFTSSPALGMVRLFIFSNSYRCVVLS